MSAKIKLKHALSAIDDAITKLKKAKNRTPANVQTVSEIKKAIDELEDAKSQIKKAIRDLPNE